MWVLLYNKEVRFTAESEVECRLEKEKIASTITWVGQPFGGVWEIKDIGEDKLLAPPSKQI